jgi:predicted nucleotidyltransferase
LQPIRDVIELPIVDEIDINGWDLKKALTLLLKSNPPMLEWLSSPIVYQESPSAGLLRTAAKQYFDPISASHHYLSMALKTQKYLQAEKVIRKKYLYVLRPLFCIEWIAAQQTMPPMEFNKLLDFTFGNAPDPELQHAIEQLLISKTAGKETDAQPRDDVIDRFISKRIALYQAADFGKSRQPNYPLADELFLEILRNIES